VVEIGLGIQAYNRIIKTSVLLFDRTVKDDGVQVAKIKMVLAAKDDALKQPDIQPFVNRHIQMVHGGIFLG